MTLDQNKITCKLYSEKLIKPKKIKFKRLNANIGHLNKRNNE